MIDFRMRRTRWLVLGCLGIVVVGLGLTLTSRRCVVVVYNETADVLSGISVAAPGLMWRVDPLASGESRSCAIPANLSATIFVVHQGRAGDRGQEVWFETGPGRRLTLRVWPDGTVEADRHSPWWE